MRRLYNLIANIIRRLPIVKKYPTAKELMKYSLVGNIGNLIDIGAYIYLTRAFEFWQENYLIANAFTMLIASRVRFIFHKHWTFRDRSENFRWQYSKFIVVMIIGLLINEVILYITVEHLNFNDIIGKITSMICGTFISYYLTKKWVFDHGVLNKN